MEGKSIDTKGFIKFCLVAKNKKRSSLAHVIIENEYTKRTINEYDFIDGLDFLKSVREGFFTDYDGSISDIIIDDYISNLGLVEEGLISGDFLVDGNIFEEICNQYKVIVNWANK